MSYHRCARITSARPLRSVSQPPPPPRFSSPESRRKASLQRTHEELIPERLTLSIPTTRTSLRRKLNRNSGPSETLSGYPTFNSVWLMPYYEPSVEENMRARGKASEWAKMDTAIFFNWHIYQPKSVMIFFYYSLYIYIIFMFILFHPDALNICRLERLAPLSSRIHSSGIRIQGLFSSGRHLSPGTRDQILSDGLFTLTGFSVAAGEG